MADNTNPLNQSGGIQLDNAGHPENSKENGPHPHPHGHPQDGPKTQIPLG